MPNAKPWSRERRRVLKAGATWAGACLSPGLATAAGRCVVTPATEDGPLYPAADIPWASDLTRVPGQAGIAKGQIAYLFGQVKNAACDPVTDAVVEIWQADSNGYYKHPRHTAPKGLDPNFRYFAKVRTDAAGRYMLKTLVPKWYRIFDIDRAAHIHVKVRSPQNGVVTSEIYFSGEDQDELRERDPVYQSRRQKEQLVARHMSAAPAHWSQIAPQEPDDDAVFCNVDIAYRI